MEARRVLRLICLVLGAFYSLSTVSGRPQGMLDLTDPYNIPYPGEAFQRGGTHVVLTNPAGAEGSLSADPQNVQANLDNILDIQESVVHMPVHGTILMPTMAKQLPTFYERNPAALPDDMYFDRNRRAGYRRFDDPYRPSGSFERDPYGDQGGWGSSDRLQTSGGAGQDSDSSFDEGKWIELSGGSYFDAYGKNDRKVEPLDPKYSIQTLESFYLPTNQDPDVRYVLVDDPVIIVGPKSSPATTTAATTAAAG